MPKSNQTTKGWDDLSLAEKISDVLNDPKLPAIMLDGFMEALATTFNSRCFNQEEVQAWERSPQYINFLLRGIGKEVKDA